MKLLTDIDAFLKRTGLTGAQLGERINQRQVVYRIRQGKQVGPGLERNLRYAMAMIEAGQEQSATVSANVADQAIRRASTTMADRMNGLIAKMAAEQKIPFADGLVLAHMGPSALAMLQGARA